MTKEDKKLFECKDCKKDTSIDAKDYYMVRANIWNKYGLGGIKEVLLSDGTIGMEQTKPNGMLCIECLERRMKRKLRKSDILDCRLNTLINPYTISILNK